VRQRGSRRPQVNSPETPLDDPDHDHASGAYLFPFYLAHQSTPQQIRQIWEATQNHDSLGAINSVIAGGFAKRWPEFAALNWNRAPVPFPGGLSGDQYNKVWEPPDFNPIGAKPVSSSSGESTIKISLPSGTPDLAFPLGAVGQGLKHLSALYYDFLFPDDNVRTVTFYNGLAFKLDKEDLLATISQNLYSGTTYVLRPANGQQTMEPAEGAKVWAFLKINGKWEEALNFTDVPLVSICRDADAERIQELVLIFSDAEWED